MALLVFDPGLTLLALLPAAHVYDIVCLNGLGGSFANVSLAR